MASEQNRDNRVQLIAACTQGLPLLCLDQSLHPGHCLGPRPHRHLRPQSLRPSLPRPKPRQ